MEYNGKRALAYAVVASLALHAALLLPPMLLLNYKPQRRGAEKLLLELFGTIAERQSAEKAPVQAAEPPPPPPRKAVQVPDKAKPQSKAEEKKPPAPESPVEVPQPVERAVVTPPIETPSVQETRAASVTPEAAPQDAQKQRTLDVQDKSRDELRRYLASLTRKLRASLVYPEEARKGGYEGTSVVKFTITESGAIRTGSLAIVRSSGHADLDANALRAAQASAPFDRPPRVLEVAVELAFSAK